MKREGIMGPPTGPPPGLPLALVQAGQRVRLAGVEAGFGLQGRLLAMGFVPGIELEVIHKPPTGPILVRIGNSRVALGRGMALKMRVE
jgi:ferrous iron transport protein A